MVNEYQAIMNSPVGKLGICTSGNQLKKIEFLSSRSREREAQDRFAREVVRQLKRYFSDSSWKFTVPVLEQGTLFQRRVWKNMKEIKSGKTESYGDIAKRLNTSPRAVGGACRANPVPIIVPCHRVISSTGIGGYAGETRGINITIKRHLLRHEGWQNQHSGLE